MAIALRGSSLPIDKESWTVINQEWSVVSSSLEKRYEIFLSHFFSLPDLGSQERCYQQVFGEDPIVPANRMIKESAIYALNVCPVSFPDDRGVDGVERPMNKDRNKAASLLIFRAAKHLDEIRFLSSFSKEGSCSLILEEQELREVVREAIFANRLIPLWFGNALLSKIIFVVRQVFFMMGILPLTLVSDAVDFVFKPLFNDKITTIFKRISVILLRLPLSISFWAFCLSYRTTIVACRIFGLLGHSSNLLIQLIQKRIEELGDEVESRVGIEGDLKQCVERLKTHACVLEILIDVPGQTKVETFITLRILNIKYSTFSLPILNNEISKIGEGCLLQIVKDLEKPQTTLAQEFPNMF